MAKLNNELKRLIVQRLACFVGPTDIVREAQEIYGVKLSVPQVIYYDPNSRGTDVAEKWRALYATTREQYCKDTAEHAATHEAWRLQQATAIVQTAMRQRNFAVALQALEHAAKERGGMFTNTRKLEHAGEIKTGGVLAVPVPLGAADWGTIAAQQQADLATTAKQAAIDALAAAGVHGVKT